MFTVSAASVVGRFIFMEGEGVVYCDLNIVYWSLSLIHWFRLVNYPVRRMRTAYVIWRYMLAPITLVTGLVAIKPQFSIVR